MCVTYIYIRVYMDKNDVMDLDIYMYIYTYM